MNKYIQIISFSDKLRLYLNINIFVTRIIIKVIEINKNVLKNIKLVPISEAKLLLKHSLTKPCLQTNISESDHLKRVKSNSLKISLMRKKLDKSESTLRTLASSFSTSNSSS